MREVIAADIVLIAPPLFEYEVESALQRRLQSGAMTSEETDRALLQLSAIGVRILAPEDMIRRARVIARRFAQPAIYDSLYAALAELRECEFWTADKEFYEAVHGGLAFVRYLPDYP
ncbi:MAG: type II toxin-antitoxin system VapC family toxin [Candidatus Latescibacteria bacterium]|nr:type II toxin-antitoxin system VapC family toxin [Candidatus Latescibacterota bacterium]